MLVNRSIEQGSREWNDLRRDYIGASDSASILEVNGAYDTPFGVWLSKVVGKQKEENPGMRYGKKMEPIVRAMYEKEKGLLFPAAVVIHSEIDFLMASLDGLSECLKYSAEFKVANESDHFCAQHGKIPDKYYIQLQHQMFCTGHLEMDYVSYHKGEIIILPCKRDDTFSLVMLPKLRHFWQFHVKGFNAPEQIEKDKKKIDDFVFDCLSQRHIQAKKRLELAKEEEETTRRELLKYCKDQSIEGEYLSVTRYERKGVINFSRIPALLEMDLEPYRGPSTIQYKINIKDIV